MLSQAYSPCIASCALYVLKLVGNSRDKTIRHCKRLMTPTALEPCSYASCSSIQAMQLPLYVDARMPTHTTHAFAPPQLPHHRQCTAAHLLRLLKEYSLASLPGCSASSRFSTSYVVMTTSAAANSAAVTTCPAAAAATAAPVAAAAAAVSRTLLLLLLFLGARLLAAAAAVVLGWYWPTYTFNESVPGLVWRCSSSTHCGHNTT